MRSYFCEKHLGYSDVQLVSRLEGSFFFIYRLQQLHPHAGAWVPSVLAGDGHVAAAGLQMLT
jgi:hypothetical protein